MLFLAAVLLVSHLMGTANVVNDLPLLQLLLTPLPKIKFVCPGPRRFPIFAESVFANLISCFVIQSMKQALKFAFHFRISRGAPTEHSRAVSNKRPPCRGCTSTCASIPAIIARDLILLLDLLHVLVKVHQRLVVFLQFRHTNPKCVANTSTDKGYFQEQQVPILYFCENVSEGSYSSF